MLTVIETLGEIDSRTGPCLRFAGSRVPSSEVLLFVMARQLDELEIFRTKRRLLSEAFAGAFSKLFGTAL